MKTSTILGIIFFILLIVAIVAAWLYKDALAKWFKGTVHSGKKDNKDNKDKKESTITLTHFEEARKVLQMKFTDDYWADITKIASMILTIKHTYPVTVAGKSIKNDLFEKLNALKIKRQNTK